MLRAYVVLALALSALASFTSSSAHAQNAALGCNTWLGCRDGQPFGAMPTPCTSGRECNDPGVCVFESEDDPEGQCLVPTGDCGYCLLDEAAECPVAMVGGRDRARPSRVDGRCSYEVCGGSYYIVDTDAPDFPDFWGACFGDNLFDLWGSGDCDGDHVPNRLESDGSLCTANVPVVREAEGLVSCERGAIVPTPTPAEHFCSTVTPGPASDAVFMGCVEEMPAPFGICCREAADCPTLGGMAVRCVLLPTEDDEPAGVCTYGLDIPPIDGSCLVGARGHLCEDPTAETAYLRWANGNCDSDCDPTDSTNASSERVCSCMPDAGMPDAGVDAARPRDAAVSAPDARVVDLDAAVSDAGMPIDAPPGSAPRFGGAGVQCSATHGERGRGLSVLALALVALFSWRRGAASRGARSRSSRGSRRCS